ncbi:MAG: hypothetical protein V2I30_07255 [Erythrobacter sp.]|nr:hypothetical protein [Erythrobacter sp.]
MMALRSSALALVAVLAACDAPADQPSDIPEVPQAGEATFQMGPGLYAVGDENATYARTRLSADGTYIDMTAEGEEVGGGTWTTRSDMICFDPVGDGEDKTERCWTNGPPDPDGSFLSTRVDADESYRVTPLEN